MESSFRYIAFPRVCAYLPDRLARMEYEYVSALSAEEYLTRMLAGWRRFGKVLFRPQCPGCNECRAVRVRVADFRPNRSQRRAATANEDIVSLRIHKPSVSQQKLAMYDKFHTFQTADKGWPEHPAQDAATYAESFVYHPFPVEEWCYYVGRKLVGVGYVDPLPGPPQPIEEDGDEGRQPLPMVDANTNVGGLSAIYFFYDPDERQPLAGHVERLESDRGSRTSRIALRLPRLSRRRLPLAGVQGELPPERATRRRRRLARFPGRLTQ